MSSVYRLPAITPRPRKDPLPVLRTTSQPSGGTVGVPIGFVLDACFVLAGNQQGELHLCDPLLQERVAGNDSDLDELLAPGDYNFVVVHEGGVLDYDYDLCESFAAWKPPVEIPGRWLGREDDSAPPARSVSDVSDAVKMDDKVCIMTGAAAGLHGSHIVPSSEASWFKSHFQTLVGYGGNPVKDLNSMRNEVSLRADLIKQGLDQGLFLFAPYGDDMVAVFVQDDAHDLAYEYHMRAVNFPTRILRGYLFVRFAWNLFHFSAPGLVDAVATLRRPEPCVNGDSPKRKRAESSAGGSEKPKEDGPKKKKKDVSGSRGRNDDDVGSGHGGDNDKDVGGSHGAGTDEDIGGGHGSNSDSSLLTADDEAQLAVFEVLDEALKKRPLTVEDVRAGRYPGFSRIKRLEYRYRRANPQVSEVGVARVWEEGDDDPGY